MCEYFLDGFEGGFRDWKLESELFKVREHEALSRNAHLIDVFAVDDESLAHSHESSGLFLQLVGEGLLYKAQTERHHRFQLVGHYYLGVVAICLEKYDFRDFKPEQLVTGVDDDVVHNGRFFWRTFSGFPLLV